MATPSSRAAKLECTRFAGSECHRHANADTKGSRPWLEVTSARSGLTRDNPPLSFFGGGLVVRSFATQQLMQRLGRAQPHETDSGLGRKPSR